MSPLTFGRIGMAVLVLLVALRLRGEQPPPDLRLAWAGEPDPITGVAVETVDIRFILRNVGGTDAFAVVLKTNTALRSTRPPA